MRDLTAYRAMIDAALAKLGPDSTLLPVVQVYEALGVRTVQPPKAIDLAAPMHSGELDIFIEGQERLFDYFAGRNIHIIPISHHLVRFWEAFDTWKAVVSRSSHPHLVVATLLRAVPKEQPAMDESASIAIVSRWTGCCIKSLPGEDKRSQVLRVCEHLFGEPWVIFVGSAIENVDGIYSAIVNEQPPFLEGLGMTRKSVRHLNLPTLGL